MDEHRNIQRRRVLKRGTISLNRGGVIDCAVRNLSTTGTALAAASRALRLRLSREVALPALIFLAFEPLPLFASLMAKQYPGRFATSVSGTSRSGKCR